MQPFHLRKRSVQALRSSELDTLYEALLLGYQRLDQGALADPSRAPEVTSQGDLVFPKGWDLSETQHLLQAAPRTLWLLSKSKLVPVSELEVLQMMRLAGIVLEQPKAEVARVQHVEVDRSVNFLRMIVSQPRFVPKPPEKARTVKIGGDE
jgi:hypothetical protein